MDLRQRVVEKLNIEFGNDILNIRKCHELHKSLTEEKLKLENSLSLASSEVPTKVSAAIKEAEDVSREICKINSQVDNWSCKVRNHLSKVEGTNSNMKEYIEKINQLERALAYLYCIQEIETLSSSLEASLSEKDDEKCVKLFISLCNLDKDLQTSSCKHLIAFLHETIHFWHNFLKEKFSFEFEEILKSVKWPIVSSSSTLLSPPPEAVQKFQQLTEHLLQLQLPEHLVEHPVVSSTLFVDFEHLSLPLTLLVRPLKKRFMFHFYGSKQTNRPDKPEWFFTQVLTWIRDHEKFVEQWVQPVYDKHKLMHISAKVELMRGLVQLVVEKLHAELPSLQYDDALFSHLLDETLGFDRELRDSFQYPTKQPGVIGVLTQARIFVRWIVMEKKYASEKMDTMLSSETAWLPLGTPELDDLRVTECAESFLSLLLTMTERYSSLPQPGHRLQFLDLQLELLDDFRVRILQVLREEESHDPLNSRLPAILNTISYLRSVLLEWGGLTHYLQLQYYKAQFEGANDTDDDRDVNGTVFDGIVELLTRTRTELVATLCDFVMLDIKARSREYRKDRWYAMASLKDILMPSITPSACPMFQVLASRLHQLQTLLSVPLFTETWESLAMQLNQFIYEEVILMNKFNEGGAMQVQYDMTRNLFPLFGQYTQKPEAHFLLVKESCLLLNLPKGVALLLLETLNEFQFNEDHKDNIAEALSDVGVQRLTADKAINVLCLRTDTPNFS